MDTYREIERFEALVKRYSDLSVIQGGGILIESGPEATAEHVVLRNNDLFDDAPTTGSRARRSSSSRRSRGKMPYARPFPASAKGRRPSWRWCSATASRPPASSTPASRVSACSRPG